jgi:hypothetical protein
MLSGLDTEKVVNTNSISPFFHYYGLFLWVSTIQTIKQNFGEKNKTTTTDIFVLQDPKISYGSDECVYFENELMA